MNKPETTPPTYFHHTRDGTLGEAAATLVLMHGRGGDPTDLLGLAEQVAPPGNSCIAPQTADHTWHPHRLTEAAAWNEAQATARTGKPAAEKATL